MIKLFATDLDGTLLNARHQVDATIRRSLQEVIASGAHVAPATGRCMRSNRDYGFDGIRCEVIASNGAMVLDADGRLIHHRSMDLAFVEELLREFPEVSFDITSVEGSFIRGTAEEHWRQMRHPNPFMRIVLRGMRAGSHGPSWEPVFEATPEQVLASDVCKVNCRIPDAGRAAELHAFLAGHADKVVNAPFNPSMFEITRTGVNKGAAVAWLAAYLGIGEDEVAVYGDGGNDIEMLERFAPYGHAYATRGAGERAKAAAGKTIGSCVLHAVPRHMTATVRGR